MRTLYILDKINVFFVERIPGSGSTFEVGSDEGGVQSEQCVT